MGGKEKRVQIQEPKFKGHYFPDNGALQRARSFVLPGQLQHEQNRELYQQKRKHAAVVNVRGKPSIQIYRPPTARHSTMYEGEFMAGVSAYDLFYPQDKNGSVSSAKRKPSLNIYAREFQPEYINDVHQNSKNRNQRKFPLDPIPSDPRNSISGPKVKFANDSKKPSEPLSISLSGSNLIKRSKSLGAADMLRAVTSLDSETLHENFDAFPAGARKILSVALNDPNLLSARQLMDVVRHLFDHVTQTSKHSESTARLCIQIIEKEASETFLETLLNSCQEFYRERDRLLRNSPTNGETKAYVPSHPKWIAYMKFLNEIYTQLKRHQSHLMSNRMKNGGTPAGLFLLTLIAQCCHACIQKAYVNNMSEIECLFFVLTTVGKDIEMKLPQQMEFVMTAVRDAFFATVRVSAVRKTLLQLIEMHAAKWQLPAQAVMYYYPGSCAKINSGGI